MTRCLYSGPMGYRLGDAVQVAALAGDWSIERMQEDAHGVFPTKYTIADGRQRFEIERDQVRHRGPLVEVGRDGSVRVLEQ